MPEESNRSGGTPEPAQQKPPKPRASTARIVLAAVGVLLIALCGLAFYTGKVSVQEQKYDVGSRPRKDVDLDRMGNVVYAVKDVPEGGTIEANALEEKQISASKLPLDALQSASEAVGQVAKYGIAAGQIVSRHDLQPKRQTKNKSSKALAR
jgi:flagella basal body P-ring formation protein FlgA